MFKKHLLTQNKTDCKSIKKNNKNTHHYAVIINIISCHLHVRVKQRSCPWRGNIFVFFIYSLKEMSKLRYLEKRRNETVYQSKVIL